MWEDRTAWPLFVFSVVFFVLSVILIGDQHLSTSRIALLSLGIAVLWVTFIVDFVARVVMSRDRRMFLRTRWIELVSIIVPFIRPFVIIAYVWRLPFFRRSAAHLRTRLIVSMTLFSLLFVYTASTAVWFVERTDPRANIVNLGDAIWWGFSTIATVGYGDYVPVTAVGRFLAVLLMVGGILIVGVTSATFVSTLTDQIHRAGARQRALLEGGAGAATAADPAVPADGGTGSLGTGSLGDGRPASGGSP